MKLITGSRPRFIERLRQRGASWEQVRPCIVSTSGDSLTVDVDHPAYPHKHNPRYWPRRVRLVAAFRRDGDRGVGDTLARVAKQIGAKGLADAYTLLTGKDCGCSDRQARLNERWPYGG